MTGDIWDIDWNLEGWSVELTRGGGLVSVEWDGVRRQSACRVYDGEFRDLTWPWWGIPSDPAEVINMARRLADEHLTPVPPATSSNPQ